MDLRELAIPIRDDEERVRVLALLRSLRVPLDPCAGDPRFVVEPDTGVTRLHVIVNTRVERALEEVGQPHAVVRDLADVPDPRTYVSRTNRFAAELARVRAAKATRDGAREP